MWLKISIKVFR